MCRSSHSTSELPTNQTFNARRIPNPGSNGGGKTKTLRGLLAKSMMLGIRRYLTGTPTSALLHFFPRTEPSRLHSRDAVAPYRCRRSLEAAL
jgi:hypothetical protein